MGSPNREPRPGNPERITLLKYESAGFNEEGSLLITATFRYEPWCCNDAHEIVDGVNALAKAIEQSQDSEREARLERLKDEYKEFLDEDATL